MTARAEVLAAVLAGHRQSSGFDEIGEFFKYACDCSWVGQSDAGHVAHVAAALDAALAAQEGDQGDAVRAVAAVEAVLDRWEAKGYLADAPPLIAAIRAALADTTGALAKHDAKVKAAALREAAARVPGLYPSRPLAQTTLLAEWLNGEADRIEAEAADR